MKEKSDIAKRDRPHENRPSESFAVYDDYDQSIYMYLYLGVLLGSLLRRFYCATEVQIRNGLQLFSPQYLSKYQTKPYDVGAQNYRLVETILLSTHSTGLEGQIRII